MPDRASNRRDGLLTVDSNPHGREVLVTSPVGELDRANVLTARRTPAP